MVVLASAVMAAPIDPNMQDCFSDAVKEQQSEYKVCASDYRDAKIACTDDYLSCKWDYWMCIFSLPASVHTINCGAINLNCRMDYRNAIPLQRWTGTSVSWGHPGQPKWQGMTARNKQFSRHFNCHFFPCTAGSLFFHKEFKQI